MELSILALVETVPNTPLNAWEKLASLKIARGEQINMSSTCPAALSYPPLPAPATSVVTTAQATPYPESAVRLWKPLVDLLPQGLPKKMNTDGEKFSL